MVGLSYNEMSRRGIYDLDKLRDTQNERNFARVFKAIWTPI